MTFPVVLFDWDGTLVDNWPVIHEALGAARESFGLEPWTFAETMGHVSRSGRESFPKMFGADWRKASDIFYAAFEARHLDALTLLPGAGSCLDRLEAAGFPIAVVSNKNGTYLRREADRLGWTGRFEALVGAGDADCDKPDTAPVRMALGGRPGHWLVGDSDTDIRTARNAGLRSAIVLYAGGPALSLSADARCDSLAAIPDLVAFSHGIN
ncbi:MAG: HAD family hydrolase [Alphaproteobacteria bacterium]|nr:HAD family hydrolase [Alphaproteobacteria bacterium]